MTFAAADPTRVAALFCPLIESAKRAEVGLSADLAKAARPRIRSPGAVARTCDFKLLGWHRIWAY